MNAIVCAIVEDKDNLQKSMTKLWSLLFPENETSKEDAAKKSAERVSRMPDVIYVTPKEDLKTKLGFNEKHDVVPVKPGISFKKKEAPR